MSLLSTDEQDRFDQAVSGVRNLTVANLAGTLGTTASIRFVENLQRGVDQVFQSAVDRGSPLACAPGCSHCCSVRVYAMEPEVFRIVHALKAPGGPDLGELTDRLKQYSTTAATVSIQDHRIACPFLSESRCSIYQVRPAVCRKCHSLNVRSCEASAAEIPQDLNLVMNAEALIKGTAEGYRLLGMPTGSHELSAAVLIALTDEHAEQRWLAGESVFGEADLGSRA